MSYVVTSSLDPVISTPGTLRYGIDNPPPNKTIIFDSSFNTPQTITLNNNPFLIDDNLIIIGPGSNLLTLNANNVSRIFIIFSGTLLTPVTINGLRCINGTHPSEGGAIVITNVGIVSLTDVIIENNTSVSGGAGIFNDGVLTLINSIIRNNVLTTLTGVSLGGGIYSNGPMIIRNCRIENNTITSSSSSDSNGGGINSRSDLVISDSVIINNRCNGFGGGIYIITNSSADILDMDNCLVSSNICGNSAAAMCILGAQNIRINTSTFINHNTGDHGTIAVYSPTQRDTS
jgi:hypothetical protein